MNGYRLGLVSVSFRAHSPEEILRRMTEAGLSSIEWGSDVHAPAGDAERPREIVALQTRYGVTCSSYGTYFRLGETPLSELPLYIEAAKLLGTDVLRLWCGTKSGADYSDGEREALFRECRRAAELAERAGVTLCMECHKKTFTERKEDAVLLMETVGSPHFRMYWQPFQWLSERESLDVARAIAPYVEHVHVFHWKNAEKLPLADARDAWRRYLSVLPEGRTLLLEFMPDGRLETLLREADALREIVAELPLAEERRKG